MRAKALPDLYPIHDALIAQLEKNVVSVEGWCLLVDAKHRRNHFAHRTVGAAVMGDTEKWNNAINGSYDTLKRLQKSSGQYEVLWQDGFRGSATVLRHHGRRPNSPHNGTPTPRRRDKPPRQTNPIRFGAR